MLEKDTKIFHLICMKSKEVLKLYHTVKEDPELFSHHCLFFDSLLLTPPFFWVLFFMIPFYWTL